MFPQDFIYLFIIEPGYIVIHYPLLLLFNILHLLVDLIYIPLFVIQHF